MDEVFRIEHHLPIHRFVQLTYMALSSTGSIPIQRLEVAYRQMESISHEYVNTARIDTSVLKYVCARLPQAIFSIKQILVGQSEPFLQERGVDVEAYTDVFAKARRRRYLFDGDSTLIVLIASKSDLDDVIPSLLALQIEWNKIHARLQNIELPATAEQLDLNLLGEILSLSKVEMVKLARAFGDSFLSSLKAMQQRLCDFHVKNFDASYSRYRKETETWWNHIGDQYPKVNERPIYFISSNTHSLINLMSGFAQAHEEEILSYARSNEELSRFILEYETLPEEQKWNTLYYLLMKYEQDPARSKGVTERRLQWEEVMGISRILSNQTLDVPTQIVDLELFSQKTTNPRFKQTFQSSKALLLNIDYPLGRTAYFILNKIAEHVAHLRGIYVLGKAASLFANRGDILIPSSIYDQHTKNRYYFENSFITSDLQPFLDTNQNGVYDNQKAVTVLGTMLQNKEMLDGFLLGGITDLEMEAGPYLTAIYEITHPKRYPEGETITLKSREFDLGIVHYVSDNPLSQHKLDTSLQMNGVDATYACTQAILEKIIKRETVNNA